MMAILQVRKLRPQEIESLVQSPVAIMVELEYSAPLSQCSQSWWFIRVLEKYLCLDSISDQLIRIWGIETEYSYF